jgi:hypothetical protein
MRRFGDGWMSRDAQDLIDIMVALGNLQIGEFMKVLDTMHAGKTLVNVATVEKVLRKMREDV